MRINFKIKGSSLIETVIAITIITICSLIATLVYGQIIPQTPPIQKYEWSAEIGRLMEENTLKDNFTPFTKEFKGYSIEGRLKSGNTDRLSNIEFVVLSQNDTVVIPIIKYKANIHEP